LVVGLGLVVLAGTGCSRVTAEFPVVVFGAEAEGVKMLRPGARWSECRLALTGMVSRPAGSTSLVNEAMAELLATDAEADALANVRMSATILRLGIVERTCLDVRCDVVRRIPVVLLPAPPSHEGHH
jgi:type II secretory pathway predicted ATPase ExeA